MNKEESVAPAARPLEVSTALEMARARIAKGWCQGHYAVDAEGRPAPLCGDHTVEWCADGALLAEEDTEAYWSALTLLERANGCDHGLVAWNDEPGRTQAEVLAAFDKAIGIAQGTAPKAPSKEIL